MEIEPDFGCWVFVIKTNLKARYFAGAMCGFVTGEIGENERGSEEVELFRKAYPNYFEFEDLVIKFQGEYGCYPSTTTGIDVKDVAIFLEDVPSTDQLAFMRDRARQFAKITDPKDGRHKKISILGFELIQYEVKRYENCVLSWKKGE